MSSITQAGGEMSYMLHWKFSNNHEWHRVFNTKEDLENAVHSFGLVLNPYIVEVYSQPVDDFIENRKENRFYFVKEKTNEKTI